MKNFYVYIMFALVTVTFWTRLGFFFALLDPSNEENDNCFMFSDKMVVFCSLFDRHKDENNVKWEQKKTFLLDMSMNAPAPKKPQSEKNETLLWKKSNECMHRNEKVYKLWLFVCVYGMMHKHIPLQLIYIGDMYDNRQKT